MILETSQASKEHIMNPTFLTTEMDLGLKAGQIFRVFNLGSLGINKNTFIQSLRPYFEDLKWDLYDMKNQQIAYLMKIFPQQHKVLLQFLREYYVNDHLIKQLKPLLNQLDPKQRKAFFKIHPFRKRAIAKLILRKETQWTCQRLKCGGFQQKKNIFNPQVRFFEECDQEIIENLDFHHLLSTLAEIIRSYHPKIKTLKVYFHQTHLITSNQYTSSNAPEGIHQDGADYILSALVLARENIKGAQSRLYLAEQSKALYKKTLQIGEGIFQADKNTSLYHDVSPIQIKSKTYETGSRKSIGFDFHLME